MSGILDSTIIDVPCPNCSRTIEKSIGWITTHDQLVCACGTTIALESRDLRTKLADVERELAQLQRLAKNLGK